MFSFHRNVQFTLFKFINFGAFAFIAEASLAKCGVKTLLFLSHYSSHDL